MKIGKELSFWESMKVTNLRGKVHYFKEIFPNKVRIFLWQLKNKK